MADGISRMRSSEELLLAMSGAIEAMVWGELQFKRASFTGLRHDGAVTLLKSARPNV